MFLTIIPLRIQDLVQCAFFADKVNGLVGGFSFCATVKKYMFYRVVNEIK